MQPFAAHLDLDQRGRRDIAPQQAACDAIGFVLVLARQCKGLGDEAREIPAHEGLGGHGHGALVVFEAAVQTHPGQPGAVDPGRKTAMVAPQVPVLVREHGQKARPVQRQQQRQADGQVVHRPAQQPVAGQLLDAGVEFVVQVHMVDGRALDLAAHALERLEQLGGLQRGDLHALGLVHAHPQRADTHPQQAGRTQQNQHQHQPEPAIEQLRYHPGDQAGPHGQATEHPGIAQRGERSHAEPITAAVVGAGMLAHAHQVHKICLIHWISPSTLFFDHLPS